MVKIEAPDVSGSQITPQGPGATDLKGAFEGLLKKERERKDIGRHMGGVDFGGRAATPYGTPPTEAEYQAAGVSAYVKAMNRRLWDPDSPWNGILGQGINADALRLVKGISASHDGHLIVRLNRKPLSLAGKSHLSPDETRNSYLRRSGNIDLIFNMNGGMTAVTSTSLSRRFAWFAILVNFLPLPGFGVWRRKVLEDGKNPYHRLSDSVRIFEVAKGFGKTYCNIDKKTPDQVRNMIVSAELTGMKVRLYGRDFDVDAYLKSDKKAQKMLDRARARYNGPSVPEKTATDRTRNPRKKQPKNPRP